MQADKYLTVTALNRYIAYKLGNDVYLRRIFIKGEISTLRKSNGHYYFTLKDEYSEISCVLFQNYHQNLQFELKDGLKVLIEAKIYPYERKGSYSLLVFNIEEDGLGQLYRNFLLLKEKLEKEGLFDPKYKKPIPEYPERIGVITSGTGAAIHDIIQTINKRFPLATIYLYPSLVQGEDASRDLIRNLRRANLDNLVDVIIIGRGGGSFEDLNAFNDELLAREIFNSKIPVISAVGHESDFTICDFVADFRAATPTAAAVKVTKDKNEILQQINNIINRLNDQIKRTLLDKHNKLNVIQNSYGLKNFIDIINRKYEQYKQVFEKLHIYSPLNKIEKSFSELSNLKTRLSNINLGEKISYYEQIIASNNNTMYKYMINTLKHTDQDLINAIDKLIILNPLNVLKKGYTIVYQNGKIVRQARDLDMAVPLDVQFSDAIISTKIIHKSEEK